MTDNPPTGGQPAGVPTTATAHPTPTPVPAPVATAEAVPTSNPDPGGTEAPAVSKGLLIAIGAALLCAIGLIAFVLLSGGGDETGGGNNGGNTGGENTDDGGSAPVDLSDALSPVLLLFTNTQIDLDEGVYNTTHNNTCGYVRPGSGQFAGCTLMISGDPSNRRPIDGADVNYGPPFRAGVGAQLYSDSDRCPSSSDLADWPDEQDQSRPAICVETVAGARFAIYQTNVAADDGVNVVVIGLDNRSGQ